MLTSFEDFTAVHCRASGPIVEMACDSVGSSSGSESESEPVVPDGSLRLATTFRGPTVHLLCRSNSHKFDDRIIPLNEPVKVGRAVAMLGPAPHNAIFDCKVLSRNHALMWYTNGKFFVQDTQSSNGTFVNNKRLPKGADESTAHEIFSGDILQFGVDVVENPKKVTHGCVTALARLYHADGLEAKPDSSLLSVLAGDTPFETFFSCSQSQTLIQVLIDATQREALLRHKVQLLQQVVEKLSAAADKSWKAMIDEERLLSKVVTLGSHLAALNDSNHAAEINKLVQAKEVYEELAKESLSKVLQEKLVALRQCDELQFLQKNTAEQLHHMETSNETLKVLLNELAIQWDKKKQETELFFEEYTQEKCKLEEKVTNLQDEAKKNSITMNSLVHELEQAKLLASLKTTSESLVSEKLGAITIEDAASESEDKISMDFIYQEGSRNNKDEIIRLEEELQLLKTRLSNVETEKDQVQSELLYHKNLVDAAHEEHASKIALQLQLDLLNQEKRQLQEDLVNHRDLVSRAEILARENDDLRAKLNESIACSKHPKASGELSHMQLTNSHQTHGTDKPVSNERLEISASDEEAPSDIAAEVVSLRTELNSIRQYYARCLEEKVEMRKELEKMAREYGGIFRQLTTLCRNAVVPLVALCFAILFVSQPFYNIFGLFKSI